MLKEIGEKTKVRTKMNILRPWNVTDDCKFIPKTCTHTLTCIWLVQVETGQTVLQAEDKMDDGTSIRLKIEISEEVSVE